jgi:hypothetical protein
MATTIFEPLCPNVRSARRSQVQEAFGRHLVEQRNRMAKLVRDWIETDRKYPIPIHDRIIDRVRQLDPSIRRDVAAVALLMADEIVSGVLTAFARGDDLLIDGQLVNYAILAQLRDASSERIVEQVDVNRGDPVMAIWDQYKRWLSRYAPSDLRGSDRVE